MFHWASRELFAGLAFGYPVAASTDLRRDISLAPVHVITIRF